MRLVDPIGTELLYFAGSRYPASDPEPLQMTKIHIKNLKMLNSRQNVVENLKIFRKNLVGLTTTFS